MTNKLTHIENSAIVKTSLKYDFAEIFDLVLKSFTVPCCEISLFKDQETFLRSNDEVTDGKIFPYKNTIYEQSLLKRDIVIAAKVNLASHDNISFYASAPLYDVLGNIFGALTILDHKERQFSEANSELLLSTANIVSSTLSQNLEITQLKELYTDFLHKAIHDLKNPLTSISLTSELLKRKANDPIVVVNFAERIEKSSAKLFDHLAYLKTIFPHHDESFRLSIATIDLSTFIDDVNTSITSTTITTEISSDCTINADYERLKEAILLLIGQFNLKSNRNSCLWIKSSIEQTSTVITISCEGLNELDLHHTASNTAIHRARLLIEMQKGTLTEDLAISQQRFSFYITFPKASS